MKGGEEEIGFAKVDRERNSPQEKGHFRLKLLKGKRGGVNIGGREEHTKKRSAPHRKGE